MKKKFVLFLHYSTSARNPFIVVFFVETLRPYKKLISHLFQIHKFILRSFQLIKGFLYFWEIMVTFLHFWLIYLYQTMSNIIPLIISSDQIHSEWGISIQLEGHLVFLQVLPEKAHNSHQVMKCLFNPNHFSLYKSKKLKLPFRQKKLIDVEPHSLPALMA